LSLVRYFTNAFTFSIDGGIGEAALLGAAFGGAKALVKGENPLEAALLGGLTGGAMSGIGGALFGDSATAATTEAIDSAAPTAAVGGDTALTSAVDQNVANYAGQVAPNYTPQGFDINSGIGGIPTGGGYTAGSAIPAGADITMGQAATPALQDMAAQGAAGPSSLQSLKESLMKSNPELGAAEREALGIKPDGTIGKGLSWFNRQEMPMKLGVAGLGGAGVGALTKPPPTVAPIPKEKSPFAGYNQADFTADEPPTPNPYYHATYAADGGVMRSYAEGGIAALAQGGMDSPGISPLGMGSNQAYPGGRLDTTQFATPTQMPTSSAVINSDYEMRTNPYTGEPGPGMANGGIAGYSLGGYATGGNPRLLQGPGDGMSDNIPAIIGKKQPARLADGEFVVPADVVSHLGNGSTDAGAKHLYNMMDKVRQARTGKKAQGKQINPSKYMPA
jgi:hypothetical protein